MNMYVPELMYALDSLSEHADWKNVYNVSGDDVCYCPICLGKVKLWNGQDPNKIYKKQRCFHHIDGSCSQESQVHFAYNNCSPVDAIRINLFTMPRKDVKKRLFLSNSCIDNPG